jgi:hypothetical protein
MGIELYKLKISETKTKSMGIKEKDFEELKTVVNKKMIERINNFKKQRIQYS